MSALLYIIVVLNIFMLLIMVMIRIAYPIRFRFREIPNKPKVSILLAARNEEANIERCLKSLDQLTYPKELTQILVGNDASTDRTEAIVQNFIKDKDQFELINVEGFQSKTKAKARVLSCLAEKAEGEVLFVTDADMDLPKDWIEGLLSAFGPKVGIVNGISMPIGKSIWAKMQAIDWTYALSLIQIVSDLGNGVTAMGNNMAVLKKAYDAVGGYEAIPFSVTEDFALHHAISKRGFKTKSVAHHSVLGETLPIANLKTFLHQRKRWMKGAVLLPFWLVLLLGIQGLYYTCLIALIFINPYMALVLGGIKLLLELKLIGFTLVKIRKIKWLLWIPIWEFYNAFVSQMMMINFAIPTKVKWKGRSY